MDKHLSESARPALLAFLLLLLAVTPAMAYALIDVTTDPSGAYVCIDDWRCYYTPARFSVDAWSTHTISGSKAGYQYFTQTVRAGGDDSVSAEPVTLVPDAPETGGLFINSDITGADVWVDSRYYGQTPLSIGDLNPGSYDILLRKAGYLDHEENTRVNPGRTTTISAGMSPNPPDISSGTLQVDSRPGGASIYLDDGFQGTTPSDGRAAYIRSLAPGSYSLRLEMPDYQTYTDTAVIRSNIVTDIHANLVPATPGPQPDTSGQLTVESDPAGADVLLDNQYKGITPVYLSDIPEGSHTLLLRSSGYQDYTTTVQVAGGTTVDAPATLTPLPETTVAPGPSPLPTTARADLPPFIAVLAGAICAAAILLTKNR